jgi:hypothetical protein
MRSKFIGSNQPCFVALVGCFVVVICRPISVVAEFLVQLLPMALLCLVLPVAVLLVDLSAACCAW